MRSYEKIIYLMLSIAVLSLVACGGGSTQDTPYIEATVEAKVPLELAIEATVQSRPKEEVAKVAPTASDPVPTVAPTEVPHTPTPTSTPVSRTNQTSRTFSQEPPEYFEPGKTDNCNPNINSSCLTSDQLPMDRFVYNPGIIFSDEAFTVMRHENSFGTSSVTVPSYHSLRAYGDDDVSLRESYPEIQLFDDGTNGDLLANDGVYTRACLTVPYDLIKVSNQGSGFMFAEVSKFTELQEFWVLDSSLRGSEAVFNNGNGVQINDSGFFINIGDDYHKRWSSGGFLLFPNTCTACQLIFELYGDQFDFFSINTRDAVGGAGYIRVHDNIDGTGFTPQCANRSHCYEFPDGQEHQRLMGIMNSWWPAMGGVTHEIGHGLLGIEAHDFPGLGIEAWNSGDGMHIDSDTTVVSNLMGPFWDPDRGWPYPVKLITPEIPELGTEVYLTGNPDDGFRIEPTPLYRGRATVRQIWSDIFLYMMGLLTPEEASGEIYYKLVNPTIEGCESLDDKLLCTSNEVTAEKVIPFTTADFISRFGDWSLLFGEKTNRWNLGILNISDRPHTQAEVTFLTKVWREFATSDTYETSWTQDIPWSYSTRGLSSINIDATQILVSNETTEPTSTTLIPEVLELKHKDNEAYTGLYIYDGTFNDAPVWINYQCSDAGQVGVELGHKEGCYIFKWSNIQWVLQPLPPSEEWLANSVIEGTWPWEGVLGHNILSITPFE